MDILAQSRERSIERLKKDGAILIPNLASPEELARYTALARGLEYEEQEKEFGKRRVRQDVASCRVEPGTELSDLADAIQVAITVFLGEKAFDAPLRFNKRNIQRYPHASHGISPHKDHHFNYNLVALFGIDGTGTFTIYEELDGPVRLQLEIVPNSLLIMKAPGFAGEQVCPWHGVSNIVGGEDGYRYLLGLRQNDGGN